MLVAYRLAGLSALGRQCAEVNAPAQSSASHQGVNALPEDV
jgi:hypothetical protein